MKMTYFVSPYDLLCEETKSPHPMTLEGKKDSYELAHVK